MTKFFSNKTLILGVVGTLTLGAINLTSEQVVSGDAEVANLNDSNIVKIQEQAATPAIALATYRAYRAYRAFQAFRKTRSSAPGDDSGSPGNDGQDGAPGAQGMDRAIAKLDK